MSNEKRKKDITAAFEAAHYRPPTPAEAKRISNAVDNRGTPGRPKKSEKSG